MFYRLPLTLVFLIVSYDWVEEKIVYKTTLGNHHMPSGVQDADMSSSIDVNFDQSLRAVPIDFSSVKL